MPRMIAPRRDSLRGSNASLSSRSSLRRCSSRRSSLGSTAGNPVFGSQFSLWRSTNDGAGASQSSALSQLYYRDASQPPQQAPKKMAEWDFEDAGSGTITPPSLVSSETSVETSDLSASSAFSSQASLQPASLRAALSRPPSSNTAKRLHQYYALRRASLQSGAVPPPSLFESPRGSAPRRSSLQHPTNRAPGSPRRNSFLPQGLKVEEDTWGQFVDTADAEEELVRRSKILSLSARYDPARYHRSGAGSLP